MKVSVLHPSNLHLRKSILQQLLVTTSYRKDSDRERQFKAPSPSHSAENNNTAAVGVLHKELTFVNKQLYIYTIYQDQTVCVVQCLIPPLVVSSPFDSIAASFAV